MPRHERGHPHPDSGLGQRIPLQHGADHGRDAGGGGAGAAEARGHPGHHREQGPAAGGNNDAGAGSMSGMGEVLSRVPVRDRLVWWSRLRGVARWIGVAGGLAAVGLYLVSRDWGGETTYVDSNRKYWSVMVDQGWVEVGRWNAGFPYLMSPPDPGFTHL